MRKSIIILLVLLSIIFICFKSKDDSNMRIRVIANSNNSYDQSVKYEVVSIIKNDVSPNDTKENIVKKLPKIKSDIDRLLSKRNIKYNIAIRKEHFPKKSLNGKVIPSGNYETLVIEIGEAKGKNWWTLLYPEYFGITYEDIDSGDVRVESYLFEKFKKIFK